MNDPVSWLQIEQGWDVVTSDGVVIGTVAQVEGDKGDDIFDGLAVESGRPRSADRRGLGAREGHRVPGEPAVPDMRHELAGLAAEGQLPWRERRSRGVDVLQQRVGTVDEDRAARVEVLPEALERA